MYSDAPDTAAENDGRYIGPAGLNYTVEELKARP